MCQYVAVKAEVEAAKAEAAAQAQEAAKAEQKARAAAEAKAKAAEDKRLAKEDKASKKEGPSSGATPEASHFEEPDKRIVHFCPSTGSFLSEVLQSKCDVRPIHEISSLRSLKQAYHELGEVNHSTMCWLTLSKESIADDAFWKNLRKPKKEKKKTKLVLALLLQTMRTLPALHVLH